MTPGGNFLQFSRFDADHVTIQYERKSQKRSGKNRELTEKNKTDSLNKSELL